MTDIAFLVYLLMICWGWFIGMIALKNVRVAATFMVYTFVLTTASAVYAGSPRLYLWLWMLATVAGSVIAVARPTRGKAAQSADEQKNLADIIRTLSEELDKLKEHSVAPTSQKLQAELTAMLDALPNLTEDERDQLEQLINERADLLERLKQFNELETRPILESRISALDSQIFKLQTNCSLDPTALSQLSEKALEASRASQREELADRLLKFMVATFNFQLAVRQERYARYRRHPEVARLLRELAAFGVELGDVQAEFPGGS